jgi:hypothetical protein
VPGRQVLDDRQRVDVEPQADRRPWPVTGNLDGEGRPRPGQPVGQERVTAEGHGSAGGRESDVERRVADHSRRVEGLRAAPHHHSGGHENRRQRLEQGRRRGHFAERGLGAGVEQAAQFDDVGHDPADPISATSAGK